MKLERRDISFHCGICNVNSKNKNFLMDPPQDSQINFTFRLLSGRIQLFNLIELVSDGCEKFSALMIYGTLHRTKDRRV